MESRFNEAIQTGNFYEYCQLVKSAFFKKKLRGSPEDIKNLTNTCIEKLIEHKQKGLVIDMAEYYFTNWVKDSRDFDPFFFKICKLAFVNGSDDHRFSFLKRMMRASGNIDSGLAELLAETYIEKEDYLRAYIYFIAFEIKLKMNTFIKSNYACVQYIYYINADMPHHTVDILLNHILKLGYPPEAGLFKLRTVLEFLSVGKTESAKTCFDKLWDSKASDFFKNMAYAIIICCEKERFDIMKIIKDKYSEIIKLDPNLFEYMNRISIVYFEKPLKQQNMLQSMMQGIFS